VVPVLFLRGVRSAALEDRHGFLQRGVGERERDVGPGSVQRVELIGAENIVRNEFGARAGIGIVREFNSADGLARGEILENRRQVGIVWQIEGEVAEADGAGAEFGAAGNGGLGGERRVGDFEPGIAGGRIKGVAVGVAELNVIGLECHLVCCPRKWQQS